MKILVTGAAGFVGKVLSTRLVKSSYTVRAAVRACSVSDVGLTAVGEITELTDWTAVLDGVDVVIHLAARAHKLNERGADLLSEYRRVNVGGTKGLIDQCIKSGVKRFIFVSSIGVNVSGDPVDTPYSECCVCSPYTSYALSKYEAEQVVTRASNAGLIETVIVRPPLVYAGHAPGNFQRLLKIVHSGLPLPFAALNNKRSMIALENLVDFLTLCVWHPAAANELFLVADELSVSTPQIVRYISEGMGKKANLLPAPDIFMRWGAQLVGRKDLYFQLCKSLVVDASKARDLLRWTPSLSIEEGLRNSGLEFSNRFARL
ncbi:NAD-dependent epimerase/dehydratase family protein [Pseudomonas sp. TUM22785]|uniref:NAD-dependent epimerase/dehydratase family protein n=1 Tax=Pseudomonas sp. TUM22785 TaxID=3019098 RepID=UPI00230556C4|nr:NAD-dependent epimerase/dehydratase family protein [Pseudomonas sp. TUM22785]WCD82155.1 NAD-dependent epimerase/dehydratase family protein [Pseudomonas sp. TUM22785]